MRVDFCDTVIAWKDYDDRGGRSGRFAGFCRIGPGWRSFMTTDNAGKPDFTLEQLQQLRNQGELTQEQYECLREQVITMLGTHAV